MSGEANAYVADLRAENARLREVVRRVEVVAATARSMWDSTYPVSAVSLSDLLSALRGAGPAPAGAYAATQGAGDGV